MIMHNFAFLKNATMFVANAKCGRVQILFVEYSYAYKIKCNLLLDEHKQFYLISQSKSAKMSCNAILETDPSELTFIKFKL